MASNLQIEEKKLTPAGVRASILAIMKEKNYDPFKKLIELATDTQKVIVDGVEMICPICDTDQQIIIAKELAQYIAPKLKGIEVRQEIDAEFKLKVQVFAETPGGDRTLSTLGEPSRMALVDAEVVRQIGKVSEGLGKPLEVVEDEEQTVSRLKEDKDA